MHVVSSGPGIQEKLGIRYNYSGINDSGIIKHHMCSV